MLLHRSMIAFIEERRGHQPSRVAAELAATAGAAAAPPARSRSAARAAARRRRQPARPGPTMSWVPVSPQATHAVASRCGARPAVTQTRAGGAVGLSDSESLSRSPSRTRAGPGVTVQRPPRPPTPAVTGHGHGRTHFVERSPSHWPPPGRTVAPAADSDPAAGRRDLPADCDTDRLC
jgi:hypothetical protein